MRLAPIFVLVAMAAAAAAQEADRYDSADATFGHVIYLRYCAACHGRDGRGDGPVSAGLRAKPIDLTQLAAKNNGKFPYEKVARAIDGRETSRVHGTPDMPVWGQVLAKTSGTDAANVDEAVKRLTHFVWSIQKK